MSMFDMFFIIVMIFAVGIVLWSIFFAKDTIYDAIQEQLPTTEVNETIAKAEYGWDNIWDTSFFFVAIGLGVCSVLFAFINDIHPVFFFVTILLMVILLVIAPVLSNAYRSFAMLDIFRGYDTRFPMTTMLMANYPIYFLVFGFLIAIVMFAKVQMG